MDFITRHKALLLFGLFMGALAGLSIPSLMNAGGVEIADWVFITGALSGGALGLGLATAYAKAKDARQIVPVYPPPPLIIQVVPAAGQKEGTPNPGLQMPTPISLPSLVGSLSASDLSYSSKRPEGQPPRYVASPALIHNEGIASSRSDSQSSMPEQKLEPPPLTRTDKPHMSNAEKQEDVQNHHRRNNSRFWYLSQRRQAAANPSLKENDHPLPGSAPSL